MSITIKVGDFANALTAFLQDAETTIPKLVDKKNPASPSEVLDGLDFGASSIGLAANVLQGLAQAEAWGRLAQVAGYASYAANAASVSSGFSKMTDALLRNNSEQFAEGMLDLISGGAGLLGTFPAYKPASVLIQSGALAAKTYLKNNPGELNKALDNMSALARSLTVAGMADAINRHYTDALTWVFPRDPLVLDLDGDGIETVGINPALPVLFDDNADGIRSATGWIKPDDGLLVLDINGNGRIDSGLELFGDNTLLPDGQRASNGYQALAQWDSNKDGVITSADPVHGRLLIWQDANQDGTSQSAELKTLAQIGIASIGATGTATRVDLGQGNSQPFSGGFTWADGHAGNSGVASLSGSLLLASNGFYRDFKDDPALTPEARALPQMGGSGWVRDLREAMSLPNAEGSALRDIVGQFAGATTRDAQRALLTPLIRAWAQTSGRLVTEVGRYGLVNESRYMTAGTMPRAGLGPTLRVWPEGMSRQVFELGMKREILTAEGRLALEHLHMLDVFNGTRIIQLRLMDSPATGGTLAGSMTGTRSGSAGSSGGVAVVAPEFTIRIPAGRLQPLDRAWAALEESVYGALVVQTRLKPYLDSVQLVIDETGLRFDTTPMVEALSARRATDERAALHDLVDLNRYAHPTLAGIGMDGMGLLRQWVDSLAADSPLRAELPSLGVQLDAAAKSGWVGDLYLISGDVGLTSAGAGPDVMRGDAGNQTLSGDDDNDWIDGGPGKDTLYGGGGDDMLLGGAGDDSLLGSAGDDTLDGAAGVDLLRGDWGNNTYLFGRGDGVDTITSGQGVSAGEINTLRFKPGISGADLALRDQGRHLAVDIIGTNDRVIILDFLSYERDTANPNNPIQQFAFADGTVWRTAEIMAKLYGGTAEPDTLLGTGMADLITGQAGDDTLYGAGGDDTLDGGAGADLLSGDWGNNTYLFGRGDGTDTVIARYGVKPDEVNTLRFKAGIAGSDLALRHADRNLIVEIVGTSDRVQIPHFFDYGLEPRNPNNPIQRFAFADGTVWDIAGIIAKLYSGTADADYIQGRGDADRISGQAGNDTLRGGEGDDTLLGGSGDDILTGDGGNDTLDGGTGVDRLAGGTGNDTYIVDNTADRVIEYANEGTDTVRASVTHTLAGEVEHLVLTGSASINGSGNTLDNQLTGNAGANRLSGGAGKDTLSGGAGRDTLDGGTGADVMMGGTGDDQYIVDDIGDRVTEFSNQGNDRVQASISYTLGSQVEELQLTGTAAINGTGNSLANRITGNAGNNRLDGGAGNDFISAGAGDDSLIGGTGNDTLSGASGADIITGGLGNDTMVGGDGADVYRYARGDGDDLIAAGSTDGVGDVLQLSNIDPMAMWFRREQEAYLRIDFLMGGSVRVADWFTDAPPITEIRINEQMALIDASVNKMIEIMAGMPPPPPGQTSIANDPTYASLVPQVMAAWGGLGGQ